jgi:hypothetical protein
VNSDHAFNRIEKILKIVLISIISSTCVLFVMIKEGTIDIILATDTVSYKWLVTFVSL